MSPILTDEHPYGEEWVYQLKWDGFRIIAWVHEGTVELYSKKMLLRNNSYPDLVQALSQYSGTFLLDGEAVILDGATGQPNFQLMQQRDKLTDASLISRAATRNPVQYIMFDLLRLGDLDLRGLAYEERRAQLQRLTEAWEPPLYLADEFEDGDAIWSWVVQQGWEGMVCKTRWGKYSEGKDHQDWFKRKTILHFDVDIVGVIWKSGRISSLVMRRGEQYFGRISSGLNERVKTRLRQLRAHSQQEDYFCELPEGLRNADVRWLDIPLEARVSGRETTAQGLLRHPRLIDLGGIPL
ncbi:DNA ligase [Paenibacillus sp. YPG26]|uniref:ATP-dependent DNA ligase n=1 Tax=Paenibacillus sp. YPG26 TaxID=2878915 RepID=UPI002041434E|nr:DNA ligase [Paenibacillus sp. YPG26]USB31838.1 DNA ligase [Paenibacillus sp. YPG26]